MYLLVNALFQASQVRTLYLIHAFTDLPAAMSASLGLCVLLFMFEVQTKRRFLREPFKHFSPEATSGFLDWNLLVWLNGLLHEGFRKVLNYKDLSPIDESLRSGPIRERILLEWDRRCKYCNRGWRASWLTCRSEARNPLYATFGTYQMSQMGIARSLHAKAPLDWHELFSAIPHQSRR